MSKTQTIEVRSGLYSVLGLNRDIKYMDTSNRKAQLGEGGKKTNILDLCNSCEIDNLGDCVDLTEYADHFLIFECDW